MVCLQAETLLINGINTRFFRNRQASAAMVFVHGGIAGLTPYCSGAHIWGNVLTRFADEHAVIALDLPSTSSSDIRPETSDPQALADYIHAILRAAGVQRCHLIAHDTSGLAALLLACREPDHVEAVTVVSSTSATPTGDGVENLALAYPPRPAWSRESQRWAVERLSYSHHHVDAVLDACVNAAELPQHRAAAAYMSNSAARLAWNRSEARAKAELFEICRGPGVPVPVQVIWGTHDPTCTVDQGIWLYRILAQRQPITQFNLINRSGALSFREEPERFHALVSAFSDVSTRYAAITHPLGDLL